MLHGLFWISLLWIGYVWIGYPIMLALISWRKRFRAAQQDGYCPSVSVLISARNEVRDIGWKLEETFAWDYPLDRLEVLIGSDASTDGTDDVVKAFHDPRLIFIRNQDQLGKNATLNRLARLARGELLFFTDANTHVDSQSLRKMTRHFADSRVGCVTGLERNVVDEQASTLTMGCKAYLEYESCVAQLESRIGSVLVCDGSIYCVRRSAFSELDPDLANDLEHPIRVGATGAKLLYEPEARSYERCSTDSQEEFSRRRRIAAQGALAFLRLHHELRGMRLWQFASRKLLRWLSLVPLMIVLGTTIALRSSYWFEILLVLQAFFYVAALAGMWQGGPWKLFPILRVPFTVVLGNLAVLLGVLDACRGRRFAIWNIAELSRGVGEGQAR